MARSVERISNEMQLFQKSRHPGMRDYSEYSALTTHNEGLAVQLHFCELLVDRKADALSILSATGADLDRLVLDRLPEGRQPGTRSTGIVKFYRTSPAPNDFVIPQGSLVSAAAPAAPPVFFRTLEDATLEEGDEFVYVEVESELPEARANVGAYSITTIVSPIPGVHSVLNELPFDGGTDFESDADLRQRYIYAPRLTGRATKALFLEHMEGVDGVLEAQSFQDGPGQLLVILDTSYSFSNQPSEIWEAIRSYMAAGVVAAGVLGATIESTGPTVAIGDCEGGKVWVRPRQYIQSSEAVWFTYLNWTNESKVGAAYIPAGTRAYEAIEANLPAGDYAKVVSAIDYPGSNEYDIYMGLGTYPYLYTLPELVQINFRAQVRPTATPEVNLKANLEASIEAALNSYRIGEELQWSDVYGNLHTSAVDGHRFVGVDEIVLVEAYTPTKSATKPGDKITIEPDERIRAGTVEVQIIT